MRSVRNSSSINNINNITTTKPQVGYDFRAKIVYTAHIVRRVLMTVIDPTTVDDKARGEITRRQTDRCII